MCSGRTRAGPAARRPWDLGERKLHFGRGDLLAAPLDLFLDAAFDDQVAGRVPAPQVAGAGVAVAGETAGIVLGCAVVAANGVWASAQQLPYPAGGHILIVRVEDAHLVLRRERASLGVEDGVLRVVEPGVAEQSFGHAEHLLQPAAQGFRHAPGPPGPQ